MSRLYGYTGRYLRVDLSSGAISVVEFDREFAASWLGGNGFGAKILWDEVDENTAPTDPGNRFIIATGPLSGTLWPSSGRVEFIAKSPLTGIYGDCNSGGFFGPELKFAGYEMVVVEGRSARPVYLSIRDDRVELREATALWGRDTFETESAIRDELGDAETQVACIGPAGENGVAFAAIQVSFNRTGARSGIGAVMGAKNLKAVAVRGTGRVEVAKPDAFMDASSRAFDKILSNEFTPGERQYGTPQLVSLMNVIGRFPTKNMQQGHFDQASNISAETLESLHFVRHLACFNCPIGCDKLYRVDSGEFAGEWTTSLEYETLSSLGSRCGNGNLESIIAMDRVCNALGMDTISAGGTISFAMELFEKGIITEKDTDGLDLAWGDYKTIMKLLGRMARREGFGDLLAGGSLRAARAIGDEALPFVMHVKGQEIPAQDGRAQQSMGLAHATSNRGADHLKGFPTIDETGYPSEAVKRYGKEYLPEIIDGTEATHKPMVVKDGEEFCAIVDSTGICKFGALFPPAIYWEDVAEGISLATGIDMDAAALKQIGERIYNLQRCYNNRHGITQKDDTLPKRLLDEPSPSGKAKGHVVYLEEMLEKYYELREWNPETGRPSPKKLKELDLDFVLEHPGFSK